MIYNPYFDRRPPTEPDDAYEAEYNEVDKYGRRFRKVGNCIEYEPEINGLPRSTFFASQKAQKVRDEENRKREAEAMQAMQTHRECPFKHGKNNVHTSCEKDCTFYDGDGCVLAGTPNKPTTDTNGKDCPIARKCNERCAMYADGCKLIEMLKCMKHGKE